MKNKLTRSAARSAFTLVELLIVVAIVIVVGVFAYVNLYGGKSQTDLNSATSQVVASIRQVQSESASQTQGVAWGIHFANTTNTTPYYAIFTGSSYASGTVQGRYPLPPTVAYVTSTLPVGSSEDVTFSSISGAASASTSIGLYLISNPSDVQDIAISGIGQVSYGAAAGSSQQYSLGSWSSTSALATTTYEGAVSAYNGYLYNVGGLVPSGRTSTVEYAPINGDGTLGAWSTTTALPLPNDHGGGAYNGYLYSVGGLSGGNEQPNVYYAPINSSGTIGLWTSTTPLPSAGLAVNPIVVYNGYIYSISGQSASTTAYAPINASGTVGAWSYTTPPPAYLANDVAAASNGYVYTLGGDPGVVTSTVYRAPINGDGSIGTWSTTTPLPAPLYSGSALANNGYLYTIGGRASNGLPTSTVNYAPINSDGSLGAWSSTAMLLGNIYAQSTAAYNGNIYSVGGHGGSATSSVEFAPIY